MNFQSNSVVLAPTKSGRIVNASPQSAFYFAFYNALTPIIVSLLEKLPHAAAITSFFKDGKNS